jgi:hypothetical protein
LIELNYDAFKKLLDNYAFTYTDIPRSDKLPCDSFFVALGEDYQKRPLILNIRIFEQESPQEGKFIFLNYLITYPFGVHQPAFPDIARLILTLNKILPVPGFGLSEMDRMIFYHYTQLSVNGKIDPEVILAQIAMIVHYVNVHAKAFEAVATRQKTLQQVLEEASAKIEE